MRILFCDNGLDPFLNFRGYVAEHFHKLGFETGVVVPENTCEERIQAKVPLYLKVFPVKMNRNSTNPLSDYGYYKQLQKVFKAFAPDIIFLYTIKPNIYGSLAANKLNIPVVAMVAGLGYAFGGNSVKHKLGRWLYKYGLNKADRVITLNSSNYEILLNNGFVKKENLLLFEGGEGVSLDQFKFCEDDYENIRFLMVARVLYDKGYAEYVEAARIVKTKYPNIEFDLLGPMATDSPMGVPVEIVKSDVESGTINYLGETSNVPKYIGRHGVIVVLVSSYGEGFNRSLMEACAMGRICITSDIPGCREIVERNVNGYLVEPKKSEELSNAMISVIKASAEERRRLSHNSYIKAREKFDVNLVFKQYDNIINQFFG